jgi:hypothetical protein
MEKYAHTQRERKKRMPPIHRSKNRLGNNPQTVVHEECRISLKLLICQIFQRL